MRVYDFFFFNKCNYFLALAFGPLAQYLNVAAASIMVRLVGVSELGEACRLEVSVVGEDILNNFCLTLCVLQVAC